MKKKSIPEDLKETIKQHTTELVLIIFKEAQYLKERIGQIINRPPDLLNVEKYGKIDNFSCFSLGGC